MKTSLAHLPEINQREILRIVEIIRELANPEKIILFGSYAKGTYTEHRYIGRDGIRYEYMSDYDLLVVTKEAQEKSYELEDRVVNRSRMYRSSVNMEIHDIDYINEGLEIGQYFFSDIIREGIPLYDNGTVKFAAPRELTPKEQREIAQRYFNTWFPPGYSFISTSEFSSQKDDLKIAAFLLHQAAETLYYTTLLVFTSYKPKTHNLGKLRKQAKELSEELYLVFPAETNKKEKHLFDLLKRGYVDARYRDDYFITKDELSSLIDRVKEMQGIVERICKEKIASIAP
ncbi:MAG TPA: HEPN domain-containing protein [Cyclobacteriaceae bacterium]|nr:HEPN domain-containing protein [Cyclobacteriaceae bacterium]HRF32991.1 HEPN domain-containing protein [Cyclobacteriaceae bacterium]